jgi:AcrR family transcriptional regulator
LTAEHSFDILKITDWSVIYFFKEDKTVSPRPTVTDERKSQILTAAATVFTRKGLHETRMDDIAEESGLSKGTLYLYYKSKDELIFAILDRLFQHQFQEAQTLLDANGSAEERIHQLTEISSTNITTMLHMTPVAYELLAIAFRNKQVQRSLKLYLRQYMDILTPLFQQGIDSGEFRPIHAEEAAIATGAILEGTVLLWVYDRSRIDVAKHIRAGVNLLLHGIKA